MIDIILPDFLNIEECKYLLETFKLHPEIFKDNLNIKGFIGQVPNTCWNENDKKFKMYHISIEILNKLKKIYNIENKVSLFFVFNKKDIKEKDLNDEYCNEILKIFNTPQNFVLLKSAILEKYIKKRYPKINIIKIFDGNDEPRNSEYLLLEPEYNNKLESIKFECKLILYADGGIIPNKRWYFKHKKNDNKLLKLNPKKNKYYQREERSSFILLKKEKNYISYERMQEYLNKGVSAFIFSGIGVYNIAMYLNYIEYIYKEDYKEDAIRNAIVKLVYLKQEEWKAINNYEL